MRQLRDIFLAHLNGLSDPGNGRSGQRRYGLRAVLYGVPFIFAVIAAFDSWNLEGLAGSLIGGYALASGVLIGVFTQLAGWRARLDERASRRPASEAAARRAVDAAVAHCLVGVVSCLIAALLSVLVEGQATPAVLWGSLNVFFGIYVFGLLILLVQSMFIGYESSVDPAVREADNELYRDRRLDVSGHQK